ncbi:hypothetical protein ACFX2I_029445 [Malus domestica]
MKAWNLQVRHDWVLSRRCDRDGLIFSLILHRLISPSKSPTLLSNMPTHFHSSFDKSVTVVPNGNSNPFCSCFRPSDYIQVHCHSGGFHRNEWDWEQGVR